MPPKRRGSRLEKDASIVIVGCGIAGLSTAVSLSQAGFCNVLIVERDASPSSRREGFGMTLTYNPKGPLAQLGLLETVAQADCPSRSHYVFSPDGSVLGYYGNAFSSNSSRGIGQRGNLRVPRQQLRQILLDRFHELVDNNTQSRILWGHSLLEVSEELENENGSVQLELKLERLVQSDEVSSETTFYKTSDLLIAADGVHSSVVTKLAPQCKPKPLHVGVILGITENFNHALLDERGFYTIDGKHRLFIMPYEGDQFSSSPRRIMWQLSYRLEDDEKKEDDVSNNNRLYSAEVLRDKVLQICSSWHQPVTLMIQATPLDTIWGTHLVDRDPQSLQHAFQKYRRVVVLGDALHGMSPFKGQGANQALHDGPLVADMLLRSSPDAAVRGVWREAVQRTAKVVKASHQAAGFWHSPDCLIQTTNETTIGAPDSSSKQEHLCRFAGVRDDSCRLLAKTLHQRNITANLAGDLDATVKGVIEELQLGEPSVSEDEQQYQQFYSQILAFASRGEIEKLRQLSLTHAPAIRVARNEKCQSALHLATMYGHYETCRWLVAAALMEPTSDVDSLGKVPLDYATDPALVSLLQKAIHCK